MIAEASFSDYVRSRYAASRTLSPGSIEQLCISGRMLDAFLGRRVTIRDFSDDLANQWILWLDDGQRSSYTIKKHRANLLSVWRDAFLAGLIDLQPARIRKVRTVRAIPTAWTEDEIRQLIEAGRNLHGSFRGSTVPRAWFWPSLILGLWDTGLRVGDLLGVQRDTISGNGLFRVIQQKTGEVKECRFQESTVHAIAKWKDRPDSGGPIWPWGAQRKAVYRAFRQLVELAGIRKGTTRWIRRSAASYVELEHPGAASEFLGHKCRDIADRHYIDPSIARPTIRQPREL